MSAISNANEQFAEEERCLTRHSSSGITPNVLTDIYQEETNIVIWERELEDKLTAAVSELIQQNPTLQLSMTVSPESAFHSIHDGLGNSAISTVLAEDITQLVDMFCCLFDLKRTGLRLTVLDRAMCPRFHVDRVPSRLVTTYQGIATEWLSHESVDRSKLGVGNAGKSDENSGLFSHSDDVNQLHQGHVALLKGESWINNEGAGLVHRSPATSGEKRLLLTLDFISD